MTFKGETLEEKEGRKYTGRRWFDYWLDADNCDIQSECLEDVLPDPGLEEITEVYGVYYSPSYFAFKVWNKHNEEWETHLFRRKEDAEAALKQAKGEQEKEITTITVEKWYD